MDVAELKEDVKTAPIGERARLDKVINLITVIDKIKPEYADALQAADGYQDLLTSIYENAAFKNTLEWAEIAKLKRQNWLRFFEPKMLIQNLRMKTDGLPIQMGSGVVLAPTGSRDNIASLYLFPFGGFNKNAAEFVTSIGGTFTIADYEFFGIYGLYKYRGNVILEEWEPERDPIHNDDPLN